MQTPVGQLGKTKINGKDYDLSNPDTYRYSGIDVDPTPVFKNALGGDETVEVNAGPADKEGLTDNIVSFKAPKNNPAQMKAVFLQSMGDRKMNRYMMALGANLTEDDFSETKKDYESIPESVWKKMGREKVDLSVENPDSKNEKVATYLAQKMTLDNLPKEIKTEQRVNETKKRELNNADKAAEDLRQHNYRQAEISLRDSLKDKGEAEQASGIETFLSGIEERGLKSGKPLVLDDKKGSRVNVKLIDVSPSLLKSFEKTDSFGKKVQPGDIGMTADGKFYPIFYKEGVDKDNNYTGNYATDIKGNPAIDLKLTKPVSRDVLKAELSNALLSPKLVEGNLQNSNDEEDGQGAAPIAPAKTKKADKKIESLRNKYGY